MNSAEKPAPDLPPRPIGDDTLLTHGGNRPFEHQGIVNPPIYRASTVLFPTLAELRAAPARRFDRVTYGRYGTPTTFAFEETIAALDGAERAVALPSGLAANACALLGFLKAGDHLLMVDSVYEPVRRFCDSSLKSYGIETEYYDPRIGAAIVDKLRPNSRVVYMESPGSLTFELQDVRSIAAALRARDIVTMIDNTWATSLYFKPLAHGVDLAIQAATKYIGGHSDLMLGVVAGGHDLIGRIKSVAHGMGHGVDPESCYLALRGLRTLSVRLARHDDSGRIVAHWLKNRPEVLRVLHPALPDHPTHDLWKRDFAGASGLFAFELEPCSEPALAALLDGLRLHGMGYSWGGYESLLIPTDPNYCRSAMRWDGAGPLMRIHVGLEDPRDLIADLEDGLARMAATR